MTIYKKEDLALNIPQELICNKTPANQPLNCVQKVININ